MYGHGINISFIDHRFSTKANGYSKTRLQKRASNLDQGDRGSVAAYNNCPEDMAHARPGTCLFFRAGHFWRDDHRLFHHGEKKGGIDRRGPAGGRFDHCLDGAESAIAISIQYRSSLLLQAASQGILLLLQ